MVELTEIVFDMSCRPKTVPCVLSGNMMRAILCSTHLKLTKIEHMELSTRELYIFTTNGNKIVINYRDL